MRRLIISRLIWIYVVSKSQLLSPMAVKELTRLALWVIISSDEILKYFLIFAEKKNGKFFRK